MAFDIVATTSSEWIEILRVAILVIMALVYALYDVFNKRDIPDVLAYLSVGIGVVFTLTLGFPTIIYSALIAIVIGAASYLLYKGGQLGLGDGFEFVAISLMMPIQGVPLLLQTTQFSLPFMLSVFVSTGITTIVLVPLYYIFRMKEKLPKKVGVNQIVKAATLVVAYAVLFLFVTLAFGFRPVVLGMLSVIAAASAAMVIYEDSIMRMMVERVYPKQLDDGDIIAIEMMSKADLEFFRGKSKDFGKLATEKLIGKLSRIKRRIPVYKNAVPLAFPTLIGVVAALLFGNLLLYVI
ncbi:MAG: prepilin peptidase [Candidatus Micrarchaeota archaeon]|nr:prepilin peptidase [Candidatus Micrarchaeota archaeon]MDE1847651.1 prepilin peptidase [Candidatus Micrarchaeota archaeon]MDE1864472.1 prepilin peptidase [Candidatus Micrarchaeota archaeon]